MTMLNYSFLGFVESWIPGVLIGGGLLTVAWSIGRRAIYFFRRKRIID